MRRVQCRAGIECSTFMSKDRGRAPIAWVLAELAFGIGLQLTPLQNQFVADFFFAVAFVHAAYALSRVNWFSAMKRRRPHMALWVAVLVGAGGGALLGGVLWILHRVEAPGKTSATNETARTAQDWASGDPIPDPDFPILVQIDQISMTLFNAVPDSDPQVRSNLFAIVHGVTLTNTLSERIVAFLELVVPRQKGGVSGGIRAIAAEIDDIPREKIGAASKAEPLGTKIVGVQFKRIVNIDPRSSVVGHVGFRLSGDALDGRFGTSQPYRNIDSFSHDERLGLGDMTMHAALRVTNQLDGSYRDFPVKHSSRARAKLMEDQLKSGQ